MNTLIVITGTTASGKSELALDLARKLDTVIISADSRQIYRQIPIGTAAPSLRELAAVKHFFIGTKNLDEYFSAWQFEKEALDIIGKEFEHRPYVIVCGGSMMYVNALVNGLDNIPTISDEIRVKVLDEYRLNGPGSLLEFLRTHDPEYFQIVDKQNHKRVIHAVEIIMQSGKTYTELRTGKKRARNFRILQFAIDLPREVLFNRINSRVDRMIDSGLMQEAEAVYDLRHLNSLNTVGYKELFAMFDGFMDRETAIERIKKNTRVFAKKQLTWIKNVPDIKHIDGSLSHTEKVEFILDNIL